MKALMLFFILSVLSMCACRNSTSNEQQTEFIVDGGTESMFSTSLLSGTSWIADLSDSEKVYRVSFTDTTYIVKIHYPVFKRTYTDCNPYYLSNTKQKQFDWAKVGKETKGEIIVSYHKGLKENPIIFDKLSLITPLKLVLLKNEVDTMIFTRE